MWKIWRPKEEREDRNEKKQINETQLYRCVALECSVIWRKGPALIYSISLFRETGYMLELIPAMYYKN